MILAIAAAAPAAAAPAAAAPAAFSFGALGMLLISTVLGYLGGVLTSRAQTALEFQKWTRARQDDVRRDVRTSFAQAASSLASLAHAVMWFTYGLSTSESMEPVAPTVFTKYKDEVHLLISEAVSSQIRLAALDLDLYHRIKPLISRAIHLTESVDSALALSREIPEEGRNSIKRVNHDALLYITELPTAVADVIGSESTE